MNHIHYGKAAPRKMNRSKTPLNRRPTSTVNDDVGSFFDTIEKLREKDLRMVKLLGTGGFSNVFLACDKRDTNRTFAIKKLKQSVRINREELALCSADLAAETAILANLDHENIIALRGIQKGNMLELLKDGSFFIALDPLAETLEDRIQRWRKKSILQKFSGRKAEITRRIKDVALGIAKGIEYLHSKGVIYRDLKPANVGFDIVNDKIKIFDFGLARVTLCHHGSNTSMFKHMTRKIGTPKYMAPEVARGDADYGFSVDAYSFAILFWQLMTNREPFEKMDSTLKLSARIAMQSMRPSLKSIKFHCLKEFIKDCWSNNPDDRPTFSTIRKRLEYMIENESIIYSMSSNDCTYRSDRGSSNDSRNRNSNINNSSLSPQQLKQYGNSELFPIRVCP